LRKLWNFIGNPRTSTDSSTVTTKRTVRLAINECLHAHRGCGGPLRSSAEPRLGFGQPFHNCQKGRPAAREEGRIGGRRPKLSVQQQAEIRKMITKGDKTAADGPACSRFTPPRFRGFYPRVRGGLTFKYAK